MNPTNVVVPGLLVITDEPGYLRDYPPGFGEEIERYETGTILTVIQPEVGTYYYKVLGPDGKIGYIHMINLEKV